MSLSLPHNCRIGKMSVHPSNWEEKDADLSIEWYIHYRFHDPSFKEKYQKGYPAKARGMNHASNLQDRRRITRGLIEAEKKALSRGYNPILKRTVESNELEIAPSTPLPSALRRAHDQLPATKTKKEIRKALPYILKAIQQLGYDRLPIEEVRRRQVKAVLEKISQNKQEASGKEWGAASYNHYRSYLQMLFNQLNEVEATEVDPVAKIKKRKSIKRARRVPSDQQMDLIDRSLREEMYPFWRFIQIFHRSGSRMAELMQVTTRNVDLEAGRFWVIVRKRNGDAEELPKTITEAVLPLWEELLSKARPGEYLFSEGLIPGPAAIAVHQLTKRWRIHVKKKLGIEADIYSLKAKHTTEVVSKELAKIEAAQLAAAKINNHLGTAMVKGHYDVENDQRLHRQLRAVK